MISHLNSLIDSLSLDHRRGAAEIVEDIGELIISIAKTGVENSELAEQLFARCIRRLAHGQPSMAPVLNLLNLACQVKDENSDDWNKLIEAVSKIYSTYKNYLAEMMLHIEELPKVQGTLITFSNSSTVARVIIASHEQNRLKKVICGEGRPVMEGVMMARKLTASGVPVTLYTDAALLSRVAEADAVWVGGDAFSQNGLVNKVGSLALAMLAKVMGIPFISLMSSNKLLASDMLPFFHFLPQNPREVAEDDAEDIDVVNEYYENIPVELINYIFTEEGLSSPKKILKRIPKEPVSRLFRQLVQDSG